MTTSPLQMTLFLLLVGLLAWTAWDYQGDQLTTARSERDLALSERDAVIRVANETAERLATAAANDLKHTQELSNALKANQDLRLAVDDGRRRLLVKATCPIAAMRADAGTTGLADGAAAELSANARSDYYTLLDQLALSERMILGLQDHIDTFCPKPSTTTGTAP